MKRFKRLVFYFLHFATVLLWSENLNAFEKKLRLGDRFYIQSVLTEIFGPQSRRITTKSIFMQPASFGGPCDVYEQVRVGAKADSLADKLSICPGGSIAASFPMTGVSNVVRQGNILHTCKALTGTSATLNFALNRIFPGRRVRPPDSQSLQLAFQLFYPEISPNEAIKETLKKAGQNESDLRMQWSVILYSLCIDPGWQII